VAAITIEDEDRGRWTLLGAGALPRVLVVLGGSTFDPERLRAEAADATALVAADAGATFCLEAGLMPDAVVGDFDSLPASARARIPADKLHESTDSQTNDLEKALAFVRARHGDGVDIVLTAGAALQGGRADHAIANLAPLVAEPHGRISMIDGDGRLFAVRRGRVFLEDLVGANVSILPWTLHGVTVSEEGVHWPLDHTVLTLGGRGISNEIADPGATIDVHEGVALIWVEA